MAPYSEIIQGGALKPIIPTQLLACKPNWEYQL